MPIVNIKDTPELGAEVLCPICKVVAFLPLATLRLGSAGQVDVIALPPCVCGSQEMLFRTFDGVDDVHAAHRKAVNAVAGFLKSAGLIHPDALARVSAETKRPTLIRPLVGPV